MARQIESASLAPRVVIVDDHPMVRDWLRSILAAAGLVVVGMAADGRSALHLIRAWAPDVVLLDLILPDMDGIAVVRRLRAEGNAVAVVVLTAHLLPVYVAPLQALGVRALLSKTATEEKVVAVVRQAAAGEGWYSDLETGERAAGTPLTERQQAILGLVAAGWRNRAIAAELSLSERTVEYHLRGLFERLRVDSRAELVSRAYQLGLLAPGHPPRPAEGPDPLRPD